MKKFCWDYRIHDSKSDHFVNTKSEIVKIIFLFTNLFNEYRQRYRQSIIQGLVDFFADVAIMVGARLLIFRGF